MKSTNRAPFDGRRLPGRSFLLWTAISVLLLGAVPPTLAGTMGSAIGNGGLSAAPPRVIPGIDVFLKSQFRDFAGKRIGLVTNQTGSTIALQHTADALLSLGDPLLVRLFCPEHGLRGEERASQRIEGGTDPATGLPLASLYGRDRSPSPEQLRDLDALFYDIQDIGSRSYTFISTMLLSMKAAAKAGIEFVVLDRPTAVRGNLVEGPVLEPGMESFIGAFRVPFVYGMTPGELASWANGEMKIGSNLRVIRLEGYDHSMDFRDTGLPWIPPSPHVPRPETALFYPATGCIGELGTVCEGVGYTLPFELAGREWIDPVRLARDLEKREIPGVRFRPVHFKPFYGRFAGEPCRGVQIMVSDQKAFRPFLTQIHLLAAIERSYPGRLFKTPSKSCLDMFDKAAGTKKLREMIQSGRRAAEIYTSLAGEIDEFMKTRARYLLYP